MQVLNADSDKLTGFDAYETHGTESRNSFGVHWGSTYFGSLGSSCSCSLYIFLLLCSSRAGFRLLRSRSFSFSFLLQYGKPPIFWDSALQDNFQMVKNCQFWRLLPHDSFSFS